MKRNLIYALLAILLVSTQFVILLPIRNKPAVEANKYENMVNSTVVIYTGSGGWGSGVFIDANVILTAAHVLRHPDLSIELVDGTMIDVNDFYIDPNEDVGFIFVDVNEICIAEISTSSNQVGDRVFLVGTPLTKDFSFTLAGGIISHLDRNTYSWEDLIQTDINSGPGNSGGPLYNSDGDIIGICVTGVPGIFTLCESAESILNAYDRCKNASNK